MKLSSFLFSLWLMLAFCGEVSAETVIPILTDPKSQTSISVAGLLDNAPSAGFAPLRLDFDNGSAADRSWTVTVRADCSLRAPYRSLPVETIREFTIPARTRRSIHMLVQMPSVAAPGYPAAEHASSWLRGTVSGPGVTYGEFTMRSETSVSGHPSLPLSIVSSKLPTEGFDPGRQLYEQLEQIANDVNLSFLGSHVADVGALPPDWRSFVAFRNIYMAVDEWARLSPKTRSALLDWLLQGGNLQLFTAMESLRLEGLPPLTGRETMVGLGKIRLHPQAAFTREAFLGALGDQETSPARRALLEVYPSSWGLASRMEPPSIPGWRILILMSAYAVLVGPINVFKLAGTRRYRLYFTTPIMALATSLILFAMILVSDGIGGRGRRLVANILLPGENRAIVLQEQVSVTGLVLSGIFDYPDDSMFTRIPFDGPTAKGTNLPSSGAYWVSDGRRAGEWFGSRSLQAHVAASIGPSRSRLELSRSGSGGITAVSTMPSVLEKVFYRDPDNRYWIAENLRPGERRELTRANAAPAWLRETYTLAGPAIQRAIGAIRDQRSHFVALARGSRELAIPSLPSIDWEDEAAIFAGPVEPIGDGR